MTPKNQDYIPTYAQLINILVNKLATTGSGIKSTINTTEPKIPMVNGGICG